MTESGLLVLAKQGEPQAIATLINLQLQPKGVLSKANKVQNQLQILLEAKEVPPQQILANEIYRAINKLGSPSIEKLIVYGKQVGNDFPAWQQEFNLLINQPCSNSNSITNPENLESVVQQKIKVEPSIDIELKQKNILESTAKMGDVKALCSLIEQELGNFVTIKPIIRFSVLSLRIESVELEPKECTQKILSLLNRISPKKFKTIQVSGKFNNLTWLRQLTFQSGRYVDNTIVLWVSAFTSLFCLGVIGFSCWLLSSNGMTPFSSSNNSTSLSTTTSSNSSNLPATVAVPGNEACHRKYVSVKMDTFENCLTEGMPHAQVSEVLGYSGTLVSKSGDIELWQWNDGAGKYLDITFVNNRLQSKSQVNLDPSL